MKFLENTSASQTQQCSEALKFIPVCFHADGCGDGDDNNEGADDG